MCGAVRGVRSGWYAEGGGRDTECSGRRAVCATGGGHHWHWQQNGRTPRQRRSKQPLPQHKQTHAAAAPQNTGRRAVCATGGGHHWHWQQNGRTPRQRRSKQPLPQHKQTHAAAAPQNTAATTIQTDAHCGGAANYYHYCAVNGLTPRQRRSKQPLPQHKRTHTAAAPQNTAVSASHTDALGGTTADYYHYCAQTDALRGTTAASSCHCGTAAAPQNTAVSASHTDALGGTTADYYHYCAQTDALRGTTAASSCHCGTSGRPWRQRRTRQPSARRGRRVHTTA